MTQENTGDYYFVKAGNMLLSSGIVNCSGSFNASASASSGGSNPDSNSSVSKQWPPQAVVFVAYMAVLAISFERIIL